MLRVKIKMSDLQALINEQKIIQKERHFKHEQITFSGRITDIFEQLLQKGNIFQKQYQF